MLNIIYQICTFFLSLVLFPAFLLNARGRKNIAERYGFWNLEAEKIIWIHAASLGEVNALTPVIQALRTKYANHKFLITNLTTSGLVKSRELADCAYLCPFDNYLWYKNAFGKCKIDILLIAETELWPGMINFVKGRNGKVVSINARLSQYSMPFYRIFKFYLASLLNKFEKILVINKESESRFINLGAKASQIKTTGYSKYDLNPQSVGSQPQKSDFFSLENPVVVLGSLRPGEEDLWFKAIKNSLQHNINCNFIIAPRHQEKFSFFADKLKESDISFDCYSNLIETKTNSKKNVVLLDSMGVLTKVYSFADLAFVGATLVDIGGHNPLEPACQRTAICVGPYYSNVKEVIDQLLELKAVTVVKNFDDIFLLIQKVGEGSPDIKLQAEEAYQCWRDNNGASERIVQEIFNSFNP